MVTCAPDDVEVYFEGAQGYRSGLLVTCAPGDVEVYLLVRKVVIVRVYWLRVHQVTLRIISRVRKVIVRVYWLHAHQMTLRFIYWCARLLSFGFIGYVCTR